MSIEHLKNLDESDLDRTVWRYLTFSKYISLLTFGALWFSKLNVLVDQHEGSMPVLTDAEMTAELQQYKRVFPPTLHAQIDNANKTNVDDGRELTVVSCWFLGGRESENMWNEYAGSSEGIAIRST